MNVFITGGTGYIGTATIAALIEAGHEVEALVRGDRTPDGATPVRGTLTDLDVLRAAAARTDAVIHLAAADPETDTAAALALAEVAGVLVFTGGVWVYGDTDGIADEDAALDAPTIVAWREAAERRIIDAARHPVLIMPGLVHGHGTGLIPAFFGDRIVIEGGENHWPLVHVDDVAELYVRALSAPAGARYLGVGPGEPTQRDAVEALIGGEVTSLSLDEARDRMGPLADAFALDQRFSSARAREQLGWTPRRSLPDTLRLSGPGVR